MDGRVIQIPKKIYQDTNKNIQKLICRLTDGVVTRDEFLRGIGYNIALNV